MYEWITPSKKILYYLPPVIYQNGNAYFLTILLYKKDRNSLLIKYSHGDYGGGVSAAAPGMCCDCPKDSKQVDAALLSLAKEIKSSFYIKAKRTLAKTFIEEIYPQCD